MERKSRRGLKVFTSNPFIVTASEHTRTGVRRVTNGKDRLMVVQEGTGEVLTRSAGFWQEHEVDRTQFVKLYVNGVKEFSDLSTAGTKVFALLYAEVQRNIGKDELWLSFTEVNQSVTPISKTVYMKGMRELILKSFLAESSTQGKYFLNPDYMWNGDRLAFVKEYRLAKPKKELARDPYTIDLVDGIADIEKTANHR